MGAPKGNKNAEKWNEESVLDKISEVQTYIDENKSNYHLGLALIECDVYPDWWARMAEKFIQNDIVCRAIKKAEYTLESRIINSTLSGTAKSAAMAIFYLKNKHGYKDKSEVESKQNHKFDGFNDYSFLDNAQNTKESISDSEESKD